MAGASERRVSEVITHFPTDLIAYSVFILFLTAQPSKVVFIFVINEGVNL